MKQFLLFNFVKSNSGIFLANQAIQLPDRSKLQSLTLAFYLAFLSVGYVNSAKAQTINNGQNATYAIGQIRNDQAQILKKCIDLPELQNYFPVDTNGNQKPVIIGYWHPVLFPIDLKIAKDGQNIQFRLMSLENDKNAEAFFLFTKFEIQQSSSLVNFAYYCNNTIHPKVIQVMLELKKVGDAWEISFIKVINKE